MAKSKEVKEWMKAHKDEVEKIQKLYDELKAEDIEALIMMAPKKVLAKAREVLIAGIIATEAKGK